MDHAPTIHLCRSPVAAQTQYEQQQCGEHFCRLCSHQFGAGPRLGRPVFSMGARRRRLGHSRGQGLLERREGETLFERPLVSGQDSRDHSVRLEWSGHWTGRAFGPHGGHSRRLVYENFQSTAVDFSPFVFDQSSVDLSDHGLGPLCHGCRTTRFGQYRGGGGLCGGYVSTTISLFCVRFYWWKGCRTRGCSIVPHPICCFLLCFLLCLLPYRID